MMFSDLSAYKNKFFENRQMMDVVFGSKLGYENRLENGDFGCAQIDGGYNEDQRQAILNSLNVV